MTNFSLQFLNPLVALIRPQVLYWIKLVYSDVWLRNVDESNTFFVQTILQAEKPVEMVDEHPSEVADEKGNDTNNWAKLWRLNLLFIYYFPFLF